MSSPLRSVIVVGASLAGLEAVRVLRAEGFDGLITVLGEEPFRPYDRPPLSKGLLDGSVPLTGVELPLPDGDLDLRLGTTALELVPRERAVTTSAGDRIRGDAVIVATGARARRMRTHLGAEHGVHVLRTLQDALGLRADLVPGKRLVVVGGGFIGAEVAATARILGLDVTIVEPQPELLRMQLGPVLSPVLAAAHRDHGVRILTGAAVDELVGVGRVSGVRLTDGSQIPADLVVVGIGSEPAVGWLAGSGVTLSDGVRCDDRGRTDVPGVVAAGDCAAWRAPDGSHRRRQHWTAALRTAAVAARALLGRPAEPEPWDLDYVWSDQYDLRVQVAGRPAPDLECAVVSGQPGDTQFTVAYRDANRVIRAVASVSEPRAFGRWRRMIGTSPAPVVV